MTVNSSITSSVPMLHGATFIIYYLTGWSRCFDLWKYMKIHHPEYTSRPNSGPEKWNGIANVTWNDELQKYRNSDAVLDKKIKSIKSLLSLSFIHFGLIIVMVVITTILN